MTTVETDRKWLAWLITVALVVVSTILGVNFPDLPPVPEDDIFAKGTTNLDALTLATGLTVTSGGIGITAGGQTITAGGLTVTAGGIDVTNDAITNIGAAGTDFSATGGLTLADALTISAGVLAPSFANITMTNGYVLTPTYTTYSMDTAGAVTITLAASAVEGQLLILINDDANATIIADTNLKSSTGGALTLAGADDVLVLIYQDATWQELLILANS